MKRDAYTYAKLYVIKYGNTLLLVTYCTLNLLALTRCSIVIEEKEQHEGIIKNKFCTKEAAEWCRPGTHVLCMYNETKIGPRCIDGAVVPLEYEEREYIRHIFNGFKRELAKGFTVLGKDNVALPRANEMHALHWDFTLARAAQAWANQCNPTTTDLCRNLGTGEPPPSMFMPRSNIFKSVGQLVTVFRFNYPDWTHPGYKFQHVGGPEPTVEKVRFAIKEIARNIYNHRKLVTPEIIRKYPVEETMNPYLLIVFGFSSRFGCAMTKYVDYMVGDDAADTHLYNAVMFVCNNSFRPKHGLAVYDTDISKGTCTCRKFSLMDRKDDCLCSDRMDPVDYPITRPPLKCAKPELNDRKSPAVVLMPIVAVDDGDPNTQSKRVALEELRGKLELRQKIKDRVEMVRDRYFKNYFVVDPGTRFPNRGPIDNNTFILFRPETMKPVLSRKTIELKSMTKRKRHTIKPKKDFSNIDQLVSQYLAHKRQFILHFATDVIPYNDMRKITTTVSPIENYYNSQRLSIRDLQYGVRVTPKQNSKDFKYNKNINKMVQKHILKTKNFIPGTYNNFLRPSKHIRKGDLMHIIVPSNIHKKKKSNDENTNTLPPRIQNPLHTYDRNNFDYNRPFEIEYGNLEYDNPPEILTNPDYDGLIQNGYDYLDTIARGDYRRLSRPDVYGGNKISRGYLDRSNYRRSVQHYDKKFNRFDQRRRQNDIKPRSNEQRYLIPDRLNHITEL